MMEAPQMVVLVGLSMQSLTSPSSPNSRFTLAKAAVVVRMRLRALVVRVGRVAEMADSMQTTSSAFTLLAAVVAGQLRFVATALSRFLRRTAVAAAARGMNTATSVVMTQAAVAAVPVGVLAFQAAIGGLRASGVRTGLLANRSTTDPDLVATAVMPAAILKPQRQGVTAASGPTRRISSTPRLKPTAGAQQVARVGPKLEPRVEMGLHSCNRLTRSSRYRQSQRAMN